MVVILATLDVDPAGVAAFEEAARAAVAHARGEAGCEWYEFAHDVGVPGRFHITEVWSGEEHLTAHMTSESHRHFRAALAAIGTLRRRIHRIDADPAHRSVLADG